MYVGFGRQILIYWMQWNGKKVVLNCFRKLKSFSFKVDLPLHSTEIGFGRGRLDVKSNWIYVLFSRISLYLFSLFNIQYHTGTFFELLPNGGLGRIQLNQEVCSKKRCDLLSFHLLSIQGDICQVSIVPWNHLQFSGYHVITRRVYKTEERF